MNRGRRDLGLQLLTDVIVMRLDRRPGHLPQPGISQLREPLPDSRIPLRLAQRRPARDHPRHGCRGHILPDRLAVHTQALRDLADTAARMPVDEDLRHIDHVERSPRHRASRPDCPGWEACSSCPDGQVQPDTHAFPMGNYVIGLGNYVIATALPAGIS